MKAKLFLMIVVVLAVFVAGCARITGAETDAILEAGEGTALQRNEELGYAFLYPDTYTVEGTETGDVVVMDSVMNHIDPRFGVEVEAAGGRTAADVAGALVADLPAGIAVERSTIALDGAEAIVLDQVPGQDLSRYVLVVNGDRIYRLMFTHADPGLGDTYTEMENLYTVVTNSFRFLPAQ